ncbi:Flp pilus assembly complex ATPase component TadA [Patescibacteria group bacterium]|nr:Flp pilus assembly complex ATPase component TadA [Patescibacteria group bacterium]
MRVEDQQLQAFLSDSGLVEKKALQKLNKEAVKKGKRLGDVLIAEGLISEEEVIKMEAYILGIPFVNLEKEKIAPEVLKIIPEPIARSHNIVALRKSGQNLEVAMLDPGDLATIDFIRKKANLKILPRLTTPESMKQVLLQYSKTLEAEFGDIIKKEVGDIKTIKAEERGSGAKELEKAAEDLPIIRIVDTLLKHAILQRASDIHIEPEEKEVVVRYRIDGVLRNAMVLPKTAAAGIVARIKVLSTLKLDEHRLPQDGRFKVKTEEYKYSVRVSILPVFDGEKIVMRLLSETAKAFTLEELGLRGAALEYIEHALKRPVGMLLVTGPTGSGKTTTLYSAMEILNTPDVNISTVEDPIEYRMPRINQTQVNPKIGLTFASGLRSLLRQDPDIIMVGEIRDQETASLAINAALTGHLVLSTLHTNSAAGAIPRFIEMGGEPFLIASILNVIVAQRLVRKLAEEKEPYKLSLKNLKNLSSYCDLDQLTKLFEEEKVIKQHDTLSSITFYKPKTSKEAEDGYKGRIGIYEVLPVSESIKTLIVQKATADQIQKQAVAEGMTTMVQDGFLKAAQGVTSIEEVLRVISE